MRLLKSVELNGVLGKALRNTLENRLKKIDYKQLVDPFRFRSENDNMWRCEFWGKIMRSAIYTWCSIQDSDLKQLINDTVTDLLSTQSVDGCISSYPKEKQLEGWDIWGRKYVLLGLLAYYREMNPDPEILNRIRRCALHLIRQAGNLQNYGLHYGMAAASSLRVIAETAVLSGDNELMDAAVKLAQNGCCQLHNIFDAARIGIPPAEIGNGKAYEMISCFRGLATLYMQDHDTNKLASLKNYYNMVRDKELFITGGAGLKDASGEFWYNGTERQFRTDCGGMGETCITATWLGFAGDMLQLTGKSLIADDMERSFYNALLGSFTPDGTNVTHVNPFLSGGYKKQSKNQIAGFSGHDCCRAQGPYGLSLAPLTAVMETDNGYAINLYEDLTAHGILKITGNYPASERVVITLIKSGDFELALRIPRDFNCRINGQPVAGGTYHILKRHWQTGDRIGLDFDVSPRIEKRGNRQARLCGPLVMCREYGREENHPVIRQCGAYVDYASAGNLFSPENTLTVWEQL